MGEPAVSTIIPQAYRVRGDAEQPRVQVQRRELLTSRGGQLARPKLPELAAAELRRRILHNDLDDGEALPAEADLAVELGISRPTLREALGVLESEGLIALRRGRNGGPKVSRPDVITLARRASYILAFQGTTLDDVYSVRLAIVPPAVRALAERCRTEDLVALRARLASTIAVSDAPPERSTRVVLGFMDEVVARCGNKTIALMAAMTNGIYHGTILALRDRLRTHERAQVVERIVQDEGHILRLIERGDALEAERVARLLIQRLHAHSQEQQSLVDDIGELRIGLLNSIPLHEAATSSAGPKRSAIVAAGLRQQILDEELQEGDPLPSEAELIATFGVSRPSVREALQILESESLLRIHRGVNGGSRVSAPGTGGMGEYGSFILARQRTTIRDVLSARSALAAAAARLAAARPAPDVTDLRRLLQDASDLSEDLVACDAKLFELQPALMKASGSNMLSLLEGITHGLARGAMGVHATHDSGLPRLTTELALLERAIAFIEAGNADGAEHLWRVQLEQNMSRYSIQLQASLVSSLFE